MALSGYIGLLCAVALHGSLSAVAKSLTTRMVVTRSELGHLQVEFRGREEKEGGGGGSFDGFVGSGRRRRLGVRESEDVRVARDGGDLRTFVDGVLVRSEDLGMVGSVRAVWKEEEATLATVKKDDASPMIVDDAMSRSKDSISPATLSTAQKDDGSKDSTSPATLSTTQKDDGSKDSTSPATLSTTQKDDGSKDSISPATLSTTQKAAAALPTTASNDPPPVYTAGARGWSLWSGDVSSIAGSAVRFGFLTFLALPVLVHTVASVATTAFVEVGSWTLNWVLRWTPVVVARMVVLYRRFDSVARATWERHSPDLIEFLSNVLAHLWRFTTHVCRLILSTTTNLLTGINTSLQHLGHLIHDSWDPIIVPFFQSIASTLSKTLKVVRERLTLVYPQVRMFIFATATACFLATERMGGVLVAVCGAAVPVLGRVREAWGYAVGCGFVAVSGVGRGLHDFLDRVHGFLEWSGALRVVGRVPSVVSRLACVGMGIVGFCADMTHTFLENCYIFLESRSVFSNLSRLLTTCAALSVKYAVAATLVSSKLVVALLAHTKTLARPIILAVSEAVRPAWESVGRILIAMRKGLFLEGFGLGRTFEVLVKVVAWFVMEVKGRMVPVVGGVWEEMLFNVSRGVVPRGAQCKAERKWDVA
ncbi:hypothetical protein HDU67_003344 [Dinochytrium kinnereticum]|nr:hypothetical protein HDU67_003344 [Dinochytrium kinnereticum]